MSCVGDADRLSQILTNLLSNAVKFTPRGGRVTITWGRAEERAWIRVRDTGIGIAPADQERIFAPFEQVSTELTRNFIGTGLGLTISRRLARAMDGDVTVESRPDAGAAFTVSLPCDPPVPATEAIEGQRSVLQENHS
jgi:signal transduction histidine kinase